MTSNLNEKESTSLLANNYIGHLAYMHRDYSFMVPTTSYFDQKPPFIGYATEGHKTKAMQKNNKVSLEVAEIKNANNWTAVLVPGNFVALSNTDAKGAFHKFSTGIKDLILEKKERNLPFISAFSNKTYHRELPVVFKINIDKITGKSRIHERCVSKKNNLYVLFKSLK